MGLWQAGFFPVGLDNRQAPLKHYPFSHILADLLDVDIPLLVEQIKPSLIIAGPPCQGYSDSASLRNGRPVTTRRKSEAHPPQNLIPYLRAQLNTLSKQIPFIIENVEGAEAELIPSLTIRLCGSSFGLRVRRHRLFELHHISLANTHVPRCDHKWQEDLPLYENNRSRPTGIIQVFGTSSKGIKLRNPANRTQTQTELARVAMGIDWMPARDLSQAIPPAYTRYLGRQVIRQLPQPSAASASRNGHRPRLRLVHD
jgi:DNA (cytosine-5)-methyltransferase 1